MDVPHIDRDAREEPAREAAHDDGSPHDNGADDPASPSAHKHKKKHKKEKKEKKEKKHKHKHRHKAKEGSAEPGPAAAEPRDAAAEPRDAAAAAEPGPAGGVAAADVEAAQEQPQPQQPPSSSSPARGAEQPSAAAAGSADHEEGELPETLPPESHPPTSPRPAGSGEQEAASQRDERDRHSKRSGVRSPEARGGRGERDLPPDRQGRGDRERDRERERYARDQGSERDRRRSQSRSRSPGGSRRERSPPRREREERRPREDEGRGRDRDRQPSRQCSRSPEDRDNRRAEHAERSRHDDGFRDRGRQLPPRPYDRDRRLEAERRRGPEDGWRRGGHGDDRRQAWGERHRSLDGRGRRSRSRSRSRERRKRDRSGNRERGRQHKEEEEEDVEEFQRRVAAALEGGGEEDEDKLIEERRKRRQQILAKHREQQQMSESITAPTATALRRDVSVNFHPDVLAAAEAAAGGGSESAPAAVAAPASAPPSVPPSAPSSMPGSPARQGGMPAPSPEPGLSDEEEAAAQAAAGEEGGVLDIWKHEGEDGQQPAAAAGDGVTTTQAAAGSKTGIGEAVNDGELAKRVGIRRNVDVDMFAEEDDIFAATPPEAKGAAAGQAATAAPAAAAIKKGLLDNYDDAEGYYNFQVGEMVADKFEVVVSLGKGVFSSVLKARDISRKELETNAHPEVAIKVIRANETMYKAGQMEKVILRKLSEADKEGRRHCIRMLSSFEYRNHLCLVFESLDLNLRELTKRYGRGIGLSINAVRIYAQQMLVALHHLKNCGVLHADIKPDNILVNDRRTVVKLCDFGSAMFTGDNEITPYLVSRFYRPPEVILGLPYDHPMDMWSVGCVIYELFTGHILFPGKTNNEMLKLMMDVKGPFPKKMLKKAEFAFKHFESDPNMSFALLEEDKVTKRPVRRLIPNPTIKADFGTLLAGQSPDRKKLAQLADLLERMMALDPDKRITPKDALRHPFIKEPPTAAAAPAGGKPGGK